MNDYVNEFITHLDLEQGYSPNTIKTYSLIIHAFLNYLNFRKIKLKKVRKEHIRDYIVLLREESKNSSKTIKLKINAFRSFFNFLTERTKLFTKSPFSKSDFKYKVEKKDVESISIDQMDALLDAAEKEKEKVANMLQETKGKKILLKKKVFAAYRDITILKLLLSTGLRISELLNIKISDIDYIDKSILIFGKGKKIRKVFYDLENIEEDFLLYIKNWERFNLNHEFIFVSIKNYNQLTSRGFELLLKKYVKQAGLRLSITPHTLRHTFATIAIEKGANIKAVSQILGHSNCKITIDIYTHLSNEHIRDVMKKCHPLSTEVIPLEERIENRKKSLAYLDKSG